MLLHKITLWRQRVSKLAASLPEYFAHAFSMAPSPQHSRVRQCPFPWTSRFCILFVHRRGIIIHYYYVNDSSQLSFSLMAPHEAMMRAKCAADSFFYLDLRLEGVAATFAGSSSCLESLNSATDGRQNILIWRLASRAATGWASLVRMLFIPRLKGDGWIMIDDLSLWFERCFHVGCDVPSWLILCEGGESNMKLRLRFQKKCHSRECWGRKVYGSCRGIYGRPPRNSWELSFWSRAEQHVSSFDSALDRDGQFGPRCRLMCLVYIRCLFCEATGTSSIGCFVCDLHRFSIKLNGSVKHWKTWYAYFKYSTRMGYVPPPRRLRYRTNFFVFMGLVQRIDDVLLRYNVSWSRCPVRVEIPKYNCYNHFMWIMWTIFFNYFSRLWRRMKLWCGLNAC